MALACGEPSAPPPEDDDKTAKPSVVQVELNTGEAVADIGATTTLVATPRDAAGNPVSAVTTWTTADPAIATVTNGVVTGVAAGRVLITAEAGGVSRSAAVIVAASPAWNDAIGDWGTDGGTGAHLYHVPAVIHPGRFSVAWTAALPVGTKDLSTGSGRIFVSLDQRGIYALDAVTGAIVWSHLEAGAQSLGNPAGTAYANGIVYVVMSDSLRAYDALEGTRKFSVARPAGSHDRSPLVDSGNLFLESMARRDPATGLVTYAAPISFLQGGRLAAADNEVISVGEVHSQPWSVYIRDAATGASIDAIPTGIVTGGMPALLSPTKILFTSGTIGVMDRATRSVTWSQPGSSGWNVAASPEAIVHYYRALVDNAFHYYIRSLDPVTGTVNWLAPVSFKPDQGEFGSLLITKNVVISCENVTMSAYDRATGRKLWTQLGVGELAVSREGLLIVASREGTVTALRIK